VTTMTETLCRFKKIAVRTEGIFFDISFIPEVSCDHEGGMDCEPPIFT